MLTLDFVFLFVSAPAQTKRNLFCKNGTISTTWPTS
jgi:hypothetical protein